MFTISNLRITQFGFVDWNILLHVKAKKYKLEQQTGKQKGDKSICKRFGKITSFHFNKTVK